MRLLPRLMKVLLLLLLLPVVAAVAFLFWASRGFDPDEPAPEPVVDESLLAEVQVPGEAEAIRVVTYNIAYGRGPEDDLGDRRSPEEVRGFLSAVAEFLRTHGADVVALQEVDFDARRTHGIDQLAFLAREAGYPYSARVTTWKANYVPFPYWPPSQHIGAMHSGQAILSRYPIVDNRRVVLPQPNANPFWYNLFYLHRSIQVATVRIGGVDLVVYNCHLEAFDVENREEHAEQLAALVRAERPERWIALGDMNSPPPEAPQRGNFADEPGWDASDDRTVEILRAGLGVLESPGLEAYAEDIEATFTFPAEAPTRRLDYVFASPRTLTRMARVVFEAGALSDHLPVTAVIQLGQPELPNRVLVPAPLPDTNDHR